MKKRHFSFVCTTSGGKAVREFLPKKFSSFLIRCMGVYFRKTLKQLFQIYCSRCLTHPILISPRFCINTSRTKGHSVEAIMSTPKLDNIPDVEIDHGRFKYILIKVYDTKDGQEFSKAIVRGYNWAAYHADIYENVDKKLQEQGIESECVGGGRILHDLDKKSIEVYGYSTGYGRADHAVATEILKKKYTDYKITWNNDGY